MGATLTTVSAITKEIYGPRIVEQLENETILTKRIEKTSKGTTSEVGGKYVTFPLKVRRNHGIGYRNELEQLQAPGQQGWTNVRVALRYGYGRVHLSGQTMELVDENHQAFTKAITAEMDGLRNDIQKDTNRVLWGNGIGVISTLTAVTTAANVATVATTDMHFLDLNMMVDVVDAATGLTVKAANRMITAINTATGAVTLNGAAFTAAIGDIIVRTGNYGREPNGLGSIVSNSGVLFNLDPAVEPKWKSVVDSTGGALSESKMIAMCDNLRLNGGRPSVIFGDLGTRRAYFNLLTTQRRFTGSKDFEGGFTGLTFAYDSDIPLVTDVDAPNGKLWFIREEDFKVYRSKPWYFDDKDGSVWKWVVDFDAWQALLKQYWEFGCERRNTQGLMSGITPG
jgi:hypothetical protein